MKTKCLKSWVAIGVSVLTTAAAFSAVADQPATTAKPEKSYTGTVTFVDTREHTLSIKGWFATKKIFNLGDTCSYVLLEKNPAAIADLRAGEKITVSYQDVQGVLIASRVEQKPMLYEGMVKAVNPDKQMIVLRASGMDKQLQIGNDCKILLRDGRIGALADVKVGNHVTVTYETPDGGPVAQQIAQTSIEFTGTLTAIDLGEKTVKAKTMFATKKFSVANDCAIVINGKPNGELASLKPNDKLIFSYDEIDGVNVVNRIAPAETDHVNPTNSVAANTSAMSN